MPRDKWAGFLADLLNGDAESTYCAWKHELNNRKMSYDEIVKVMDREYVDPGVPEEAKDLLTQCMQLGHESLEDYCKACRDLAQKAFTKAE